MSTQSNFSGSENSFLPEGHSQTIHNINVTQLHKAKCNNSQLYSVDKKD